MMTAWGTYHAIQGLLLLVTSFHVASLRLAHVLLQLCQGVQLLSACVPQLLHKVIACLHQTPMTSSTLE